MEFNLIVLLVISVFAVFLIFKEIKRSDRSRLIWRLFANIMMLTCFTLLIIPISYSVKRQGTTGVLNLLTEGVNLDTVKTITGAKFDLDSNTLHLNRGLRITHLVDLDYYLKEHPAIKKVNLYGYGLNKNELSKLNGYQVVFHPANVPSGFISASWQKKIKATESLKVQGVYHNSTPDRVKLKLYGMGASLDSVNVEPNAQLNFSFIDQPKQKGRAVFNLIALHKNDTLSVEPIPFEVEDKQSISVLILASFPDFEYKFLKKWLYENQYSIVLRSQISKDKYSTDFLNSKAVNLNRLNENLLKNIDLVIIDEDELSAIPAADKASIYNAVDQGMGLIIRVTNPKPQSNNQNFNQYEVLAPLEKPLPLKSYENLRFSNLSIKQNIFLRSSSGQQAVVNDEGGKIVVNSQLSGKGKILTSSLSSTYQWQLAGKIHDYSSFWSLLFAKSLRKKIANESFELMPQFPTVDGETRVVINLSDNKIPEISIDSAKISPRQNMEIPFEWDGLHWAKATGWQVVSVNQKNESVYFYKKTDWKNAKSFAKLNHTLNFVANQPINDVNEGRTEYIDQETWSVWWFFLGFMLAISFLWYEQRYLANK